MRISILFLCLALGVLVVSPSLSFTVQNNPGAFSPGKAVELGTVNVSSLSTIQAGQTASQSTGFSGVSVSVNLNGVFGGAPNPCGCTPPDPNLGVGPSHVFMTANIAGIIYFTNGTIAKNTFSLGDLFKQPASSVIGDPEVMFDTSSNRWFVSSIIAPNNVEFAVSTSTDPTGTYVLYTISGGNIFPDQPFIATSDDKFVVSVNAFRGNRFVGAEFWVFNKAELVNGQASPDFTVVGPVSGLFSAHPARHLTHTTNFYLVSVAFGRATAAQLVTLVGVPPNPLSVTTTSISINPVDNPPHATQPTTGTKVITNDDRVLSAVWESDTLWFSLNDACVPVGDSMLRSCARLVELSTAKGTPTKLQDFDYSITNSYLFYPALSLNQGNLVLVFGESSQTIFPSLLVTGRLATDPAGTLNSPVVIRTGTADDKSTRYGDYFGATTDPSGNFWVTGEYRVDETLANWSTAIAEVQVS